MNKDYNKGEFIKISNTRWIYKPSQRFLDKKREMEEKIDKLNKRKNGNSQQSTINSNFWR